MEYNLPKSITNENDLKIYEKYLRLQKNQKDNQISIYPKCDLVNYPESFVDYIKSYKGKLARIESIIGNKIITKIGFLMGIGKNYIVINPLKSNNFMVIDLQSVRYITIINNKF